MPGARHPQTVRAARHDALSRRAIRKLIAPVCAVFLPVTAAIVLTSGAARPDLFDLTPQTTQIDGYLLVAWYELEIGHRSLKTGGVSTGAAVRALGYMMGCDEPIRNGQFVRRFILLPETEGVLHPAHCYGDQMIEVRLHSNETARFAERSLIWAWGTVQIGAGDPGGHTALYILENARMEPARTEDIPRYFK
jgi:hypothetical protein